MAYTTIQLELPKQPQRNLTRKMLQICNMVSAYAAHYSPPSDLQKATLCWGQKHSSWHIPPVKQLNRQADACSLW